MKTDFTRAGLSAEGFDAKESTRRMALEHAQESPILCSRTTGKLRFGWLELAGKGAPTLDLLLREGAITPDGPIFHGVDLDTEVVAGCEVLYADAPTEFRQGRLETLLLQEDLFRDVGVLVFDSEYVVRRKNLEALLGPVAAFARRQQARLGDFLLVVNICPGRSSAEDFESYRETLSRLLGIDLQAGHFHRYHSGLMGMAWLAVRLGF